MVLARLVLAWRRRAGRSFRVVLPLVRPRGGLRACKRGQLVTESLRFARQVFELLDDLQCVIRRWHVALIGHDSSCSVLFVSAFLARNHGYATHAAAIRPDASLMRIDVVPQPFCVTQAFVNLVNQ